MHEFCISENSFCSYLAAHNRQYTNHYRGNGGLQIQSLTIEMSLPNGSQCRSPNNSRSAAEQQHPRVTEYYDTIITACVLWLPEIADHAKPVKCTGEFRYHDLWWNLFSTTVSRLRKSKRIVANLVSCIPGRMLRGQRSEWQRSKIEKMSHASVHSGMWNMTYTGTGEYRQHRDKKRNAISWIELII